MTPVADTLTLEQEARQVSQEALAVVKKAESIKVVDQVTRVQAAELGRVIATLESAAKEKFDAIKKPLTEAKNRVLAWEHEVVDPLVRVKRLLSAAIGLFDQSEERKRREEEERIQTQLRVQAEAEERERAANQAIADAMELEAQGDKAGAEAVLNNPVPQLVYVPPVILQRETVKVAGVASQQTWKFRITNRDLIPREYMIPDEKVIGQIVRALKDKANIPGIEVYPEGGARFTKA
jgi:hypothetical protein